MTKSWQWMLAPLATVWVALGFYASGCYSVAKPTGPVNWTVQCAAQIPVIGDSLLASLLSRDSDATILLKVGNMLDKTRFTVDTDLLMKKMRTHLVNHGRGRIAVFDNDADVAAFCERRREKRAREAYKGEIKYLAGCILRSAILRGAKRKLVVVPMNGMNVAASRQYALLCLFLREELFSQSDGRITFLSQDRVREADYIINGGLVCHDSSSASLDGSPNCDMLLRVAFERASSPGETCFEASVPVREKLFDSALDATYILSGELNVLTRETPSFTDDFVRMGFNIINPDTKLHVCEGACEISATTHKSILYQ